MRTKFLDFNARHQPKTNIFCCRCQRDIRPGTPYRMVHLIGGGAYVLHPADEANYKPDAGDCGAHPIGPDCARKLGLGWTHQAQGE
ncbi:MAG: hypothetical protein C4523_02390 [Myxococcales bacterium]|nr:MAG: hypothetical protein C4523_02390 [Myxococcales bacterium]